MLVMGGGSNLVVADSGFQGTVIRVVTAGLSWTSDPESGALVTAEAGEDWDGLVSRAVVEQWRGVEALSGIPGTVGAVPIQNVGAYGQEVAETVSEVHVLDRVDGLVRSLAAEECGFGYRTSCFKREPGRYVVGAVTFRFQNGSLGSAVRYAELAGRLGVDVGGQAAAGEVRGAVLELRRSKGMVLDAADHDTWSVGSFFTNPFVDAAALPPGAPSYPQPNGTVKTSAAWLIDRAGLRKGYGTTRVRAIYQAHAGAHEPRVGDDRRPAGAGGRGAGPCRGHLRDRPRARTDPGQLLPLTLIHPVTADHLWSPATRGHPLGCGSSVVRSLRRSDDGCRLGFLSPVRRTVRARREPPSGEICRFCEMFSMQISPLGE